MPQAQPPLKESHAVKQSNSLRPFGTLDVKPPAVYMGVRFAEAVTMFEDDAMLTMPDHDPEEERFVAIGMGSVGRILVAIYTIRGDRVRIISARKATRSDKAEFERRSK